jgi:dolichyl-diphosphooligosaccharide--protein glycosyltransferase
MIIESQLFKIGNFNFQLNHLLIIGILILCFSISLTLRSQILDYGTELHEFDPFFNFRATEFLVNNGLLEYLDWHDMLSWYPNGRDISATSQIMLHVTAAATYQIFAGNIDLYNFTILFPGIVGSLTTIIIFALVRVVGGTAAGLLSSLLFAISAPIMIRGSMGWFKSEPLGLFYGLFGLYLFLSGIKSDNKKISIFKLIGGGVFLAFGLASWGGIQFFIIPIGIFIFALPFLRKDFRFLIWSVPVFVTSLLLTTAIFERPGIGFVFGMGGFSLIIPTIFLIICSFIQKFNNSKNQTRNYLILLVAIIIIGSFVMIINTENHFLPSPSFRYLNAINPFLTTTDPLVDSVAEHSTTSIHESFFMHSILMIFAGLGAWIIFNKIKSEPSKDFSRDLMVFTLILGLTGVYVGSAFVRLELFTSISLIFLSSIGLSIITKDILSYKKQLQPTRNKIIKISYVGGILILMMLPLVFPASNWVSILDKPASILTGASIYDVTTNDWNESLEWIKLNTPSDSIILSWWDYGYWITTVSERTTLVDNATIDSKQIQKVAKILLSSPDDAWNMLQETDSDYVMIFVVGQKFQSTDDTLLYLLEGGGDESKKMWFMKIAGVPVEKYLHSDGISGTDYFWNETLLGKMIPFSLVAYTHPPSNLVSLTYVPGFTGIYTNDIKYSEDGDGPLQLVYASSSFIEQKPGTMIGIFVYEVNKNYISSQNLSNLKISE